MPGLAVLLSCAGSNLTDLNGWGLECVGGESFPHNGGVLEFDREINKS